MWYIFGATVVTKNMGKSTFAFSLEWTSHPPTFSWSYEIQTNTNKKRVDSWVFYSDFHYWGTVVSQKSWKIHLWGLSWLKTSGIGPCRASEQMDAKGYIFCPYQKFGDIQFWVSTRVNESLEIVHDKTFVNNVQQFWVFYSHFRFGAPFDLFIRSIYFTTFPTCNIFIYGKIGSRYLMAKHLEAILDVDDSVREIFDAGNC